MRVCELARRRQVGKGCRSGLQQHGAWWPANTTLTGTPTSSALRTHVLFFWLVRGSRFHACVRKGGIPQLVRS